MCEKCENNYVGFTQHIMTSSTISTNTLYLTFLVSFYFLDKFCSHYKRNTLCFNTQLVDSFMTICTTRFSLSIKNIVNFQLTAKVVSEDASHQKNITNMGILSIWEFLIICYCPFFHILSIVCT